MTSEADIMRSIQIEATRIGARLFRNSVGMAWTGIVKHDGDRVIITHPRAVTYGFPVGSADLVGWLPCIIGNHRVPVFASCEVKTKRGRPTAEQTIWHDQVQHHGGLATISRSVDEFLEAIDAFKALHGFR